MFTPSWLIISITLAITAAGRGDDGLRPPLIPEGARIVDTSGSLERSQRHHAWVFAPASPMPKGTQLLVMPSSGLEEMEESLTGSGADAGQFIITGRIYQWQGENYLLPDVVQLPRRNPVAATDDAAATDLPTPTADAREGGDAWDDGGPGIDDVAAITRALHDSVGGVTPSLDQGGRDPSERPSPTTQSVESILRGDRPSFSATIEPPAITHPPVLIARRGVFRQDAHGAIVLILDAQETSAIETPLVLLPTTLHHRAHQLASAMNAPTPVLVTGEVVTYRSRRFLLPSSISAATAKTTLGQPRRGS
jgi:hypothetical protein